MPRTTREYLLRYADQSIAAYDKIMERLLMIQVEYKENYPDHAKAIEFIAQETLRLQETLQMFRDEVM